MKRSSVNLERSLPRLLGNAGRDRARQQSGERIHVGAQRASAISDAVGVLTGAEVGIALLEPGGGDGVFAQGTERRETGVLARRFSEVEITGLEAERFDATKRVRFVRRVTSAHEGSCRGAVGERHEVGVGDESSSETVGGEGSGLTRERSSEFDEGRFSLMDFRVVVGADGDVGADGESERDEGEDEEKKGGDPVEGGLCRRWHSLSTRGKGRKTFAGGIGAFLFIGVTYLCKM